MASSFVDSVGWDGLEDAYGPAADVPELLEKVRAAKGKKLYHALDELCSHVCHQGTIYSASPPAARAVLEMLPGAAAREKALLTSFLAEMAGAARLAVEEGPAPRSCAGGDPKDGEAIRREFLEAASLLTADLAHSDARIRAKLATILMSLGDAGMARRVRDRYRIEDDAQVRQAMLNGLVRARTLLDDWLGFLTTALARESSSENRFVVRCAQMRELQSASDAAAVDELVSTFVRSSGWQESEAPDEEQFFEAIGGLGRDRELAALRSAFDLTTDDDLLRILAEHLLRLAFDDQRTGWGQIRQSRLNEDGSKRPPGSLIRMAFGAAGLLIMYKLFPFAVRWYVRRIGRKRKGIQNVEYWGVKGEAPKIPVQFNEMQRRILSAFAAKAELWQFRTNLWELFGLPDSAEGVGRLAGAGH